MKYKLIQEYPGLPDWATIGAIATINTPPDSYIPDSCMPLERACFDHIPRSHVEQNPKFWEPVKEPTWEIYQVKSKWSGSIFTYLFHDTGSRELFSNSYKDRETYPIHAVKRLSDGEIFTVGDRIYYSKDDKDDLHFRKGCLIDCFSLQNDEVFVNFHYVGSPQLRINDWVKWKAKVIDKPIGLTPSVLADKLSIYAWERLMPVDVKQLKFWLEKAINEVIKEK